MGVTTGQGEVETSFGKLRDFSNHHIGDDHWDFHTTGKSVLHQDFFWNDRGF